MQHICYIPAEIEIDEAISGKSVVTLFPVGVYPFSIPQP